MNWAIYDDGAFVINGDNNYSARHGAVDVCGDNLNNNGYYNDPINGGTGNLIRPWKEHLEKIYSVEFAKLTKIPNFEFYFYKATNLISWNPYNLDVGAIESTSNMFAHCSSLKSFVSPYIAAPKIKNMQSMFRNCGCAYINLSRWDISSVTDLRWAFMDCKQLKTLYLNDWQPTPQKCTLASTFAWSPNLETIYCRYPWNVIDSDHLSFDGCNKLSSKTTGKTYTVKPDKEDSLAKWANPVDGYFTIPPEDLITVGSNKKAIITADKKVLLR